MGGAVSLRFSRQLEVARVLVETGVARPMRPSRLLGGIAALRRWGLTLASGYAVAAVRFPDEPAIVDELGTLTFAEVDRRSDGIAFGLAGLGIAEGDCVAVLCRNHRGFVEALVALAKLGADALLLNTSFAGPQIAAALTAERAVAVIHDEEFTDLLRPAGRGRRRVLAWTDTRASARRTPTLDRLVAEHADDAGPPPRPGRDGRIIVLTSGTTGAPKGAARSNPSGLDPVAALLSRIPLRSRDTAVVAAPLFHAWGLAHLMLGALLSTTLVLQRRFDPEATLAAAARHRAGVLVAVPVMLQRILEVPREQRRASGTLRLRVVAVSGSALPGPLATRFMDEFGDVLYNLYGSTEAAWATIATPADLRAAPGTAGRPPAGTVVRILDERGRALPVGRSGRIFVANSMVFEGYTGGGDKHRVDGLVSTGDVGRFDAAGRLFVEGRDDDMIVSGGENVFPGEVEDLLLAHPCVADVAVTGVSDAEYGQRLAAFVVLRRGASLDAEQVRVHVRANLARYKVPRDVAFVASLPRNATGKVVKRALLESAAEGPG
jgi:acyl-CoA synthetase (AMP-forming)/AMP-acid ligase II